jgi:hypothetical protein
MTHNALRVSIKFADFILEEYPQGLLDGDEGEWTENNRIDDTGTFGVSIARVSRETSSYD